MEKGKSLVYVDGDLNYRKSKLPSVFCACLASQLSPQWNIYSPFGLPWYLPHVSVIPHLFLPHRNPLASYEVPPPSQPTSSRLRNLYRSRN